MNSTFATTVAAVGLLAASAASAQVTGEVVSRTVNYIQAAPVGDSGGAGNNLAGSNGPVADGAVQYMADFNGYPSYNNYQVSTTIDNLAGYIAFANNASSAGARSFMQATTTVQVNYTNPTVHTINPTLSSTIIPGGFGLYVGDLGQNPTLTGRHFIPTNFPHTYVPIVADVNKTPLYAGGSFNDSGLEQQSSFADSAGFSFQILSGATVVASYSATLTMVYNQDAVSGAETWTPTLTTNFSDPLAAAFPLKNFADFSAANGGIDDPLQAVNYAWDATDVVLDLGPLAAGASTSLTYITTVTTQTYEYQEQSPDHTVIAYAGFGDPIGKAGGAKGVADPAFPLLQLGLPDLQADPNTGEFTLNAAKFNNVYSPAQLPINNVVLEEPSAPPVPEPHTWALVMTGVGLVGSALRRRRSAFTA